MEQWTNYATRKEIWIATLRSQWRVELVAWLKMIFVNEANPSASRKMTFWDDRIPPLQEKWWFSPGNFCKMGIFAYLPQWLWLLSISPKGLEKSFFWFAKCRKRLLVSFFCIDAGSVRLWVVFFLCMKNLLFSLVIVFKNVISFVANKKNIKISVINKRKE